MDILNLIIIFLISSCLTAFFIFSKVSTLFLSIPNKRSSHNLVTPSAGGIAFVTSFLLALYFFPIKDLNHELLLVISITCGIVSLTGLLDDLLSLGIKVRLLVYVFCCFVVCYYLEGVNSLVFFNLEINFGFYGIILAILFMIWFINLYNFMDGIDGLAGIEAISCSLLIEPEVKSMKFIHRKKIYNYLLK